MRKTIVLSLLLGLVACSNEPPPEFSSFRLVDEEDFEICFKSTFKDKELRLALEYTYKDGTTIDRKWHNEFKEIRDYSDDYNSQPKCYKAGFFQFMDAANSTPKEISRILLDHSNNKVKSAAFRVATSKYPPSGGRFKTVDKVYVSGIYEAESGTIELTNPTAESEEK